MKKDNPIQKTINNFFAIQARRLSRETNKTNNKNVKGRDTKATKR